MKEAVIVAFGRSPVGRAFKGGLKDLRPEDVAAQVVKGVIKKVPELELSEIDDIVFGCAFPEAEQGFNVARIIGTRAGIPNCVPAQTINRFCSSGLQAIALGANNIMTGQAEIVLAGGVEFMSAVPMGGNVILPNPYLMDNYPEAYVSMGITAENVATRYGITREEQDEFAAESHRKAASAQLEGKFDNDIIPVESTRLEYEDGRNVQKKTVLDRDDGIRPGTTCESLSTLRPVFKKNGTVTAGNASQMSDGAAVVLLMSKEKAAACGIKPIAAYRSFCAAGVDPDVMGIGPIEAIPKALKLACTKLSDIDLIELNEAFASQSIACIRELGLRPEITNVNGGAIALGHPLGCTGAFLTIKLLSELARRKKVKGLVSMCIGGGMGAAAVFEMLE